MTLTGTLLALPVAIMSHTAFAQESRRVPLHSEITDVHPMTGVVLWSENFNAAKHPDAITLE